MTEVKYLDIPSLRDVIVELVRAGCAPERLEVIAARAVFRALRLEGIDFRTAIILKEEMLSAGGDAALPAGLPEDAAAKVDALLFGTLEDYRRFLGALSSYENMRSLGSKIKKALMNVEGSKPPPPLVCGRGKLEFGEKTYIMGILNITPDSFYDGGKNFNLGAALREAEAMINAGVDIIDIGGESTRPSAETVSLDEELRRVIPVIENIRRKNQKVLISIDTCKSAVAEKALDSGADIVNDISALRFDNKMASLIAGRKVPVCLMHMQGTPRDMQRDPHYERDVCFEIIDFLAERVEYAASEGIPEGNIVIDPGIGFGKTVEHNLIILNWLNEFRVLGRPILIGSSRKSFIGKVLDLEPTERLEGSLSSAVVAAARGADIVRVHDYAETIRGLRLADAIIRKKRMARGVHL